MSLSPVCDTIVTCTNLSRTVRLERGSDAPTFAGK
jgi:hypothetical protein